MLQGEKPVNHRFFTVLCAALASIGTLFSGPSVHAQSTPWVTAYYAGWMQGWSNNGHLPAQNIDYSALTHIIHFSLTPNTDGTLNSDANSITPTNSAELVSRAHAAGRKVIISIGGWASDTGFRGATSASNRSRFISNLVSFMTTRGYDGIDIDWERLEATDGPQYTAFIRELRTALNALSPRPLLTAAVTWQPGVVAQVQDQFDQINIMTYDLSGAWPGWVTWHNAPVYDGGVRFPSTGGAVPSANGMVDNFIGAGVPASKLGIGIDFYGYVWSGGDGTLTGGVTLPGQSWLVAPTVQANVPYYTIMDTYYNSTYDRWDDGAKAAYLSIDGLLSVNDKFISYDNERTAQAKSAYVQSKGIGGVIIWELGGGYRPNQPAGQHDLLLQAVKQAFGGTAPPPPPPADTTPPSVALTAPASGATVSGTIPLSADATDNVGVAGVRFTVDGTTVGSEDTSSPYSVSWNTTQVADGSHTISAIARDAAGNQTTASRTVTVSNAPPPPPSTTNLTVYQDALATPWINASWSATVDFASGPPVYAGSRAIKVVQNKWGALSMHSGPWGGSVAVDPAKYQSLSFAVHGGTSGLTLGVRLENDGGSSFPQVTYGWIPANQWVAVSIPMSQLNPNKAAIHRLNIFDTKGKSATFYIDELRFTSGSDTATKSAAVPQGFSLDQNYPNPFNPSTVVRYTLPQEAQVTLEVYNILGQRVAVLVDGVQGAGSHETVFQSDNLSSGVYLYRLTATPVGGDGTGAFVATKKMQFLK
jgi:chitinase